MFDLLNSAKAIVFGGKQEPYTLLMSTVNSICSMICSTATTIKLYKQIVRLALFDANVRYLNKQKQLSCSNQLRLKQDKYTKRAF